MKKADIYTVFNINNEWMNVYLYENKIYHNGIDEPFILVLYKKLKLGEDVVYAKPIEMFLSEIEENKYE